MALRIQALAVLRLSAFKERSFAIRQSIELSGIFTSVGSLSWVRLSIIKRSDTCFLIAHKRVVDLFELRITLGVPEGRIFDCFRVGWNRCVVQCVIDGWVGFTEFSFVAQAKEVFKLFLRYPTQNFAVELGRGRGISNLDKKARITRPAPLIWIDKGIASPAVNGAEFHCNRISNESQYPAPPFDC